MKKVAIVLILLIQTTLMFAGLKEAKEYSKQLFDYDLVIEQKEPFTYYEVYKGKEVLGYVINSDDLKVTRFGMLGKVPVTIILDTKSNIKNIIIEPNNETAINITRIKKSNFFKKLFEYKNDNSIEIDGVAGASMSCKALYDGVAYSVTKFNKSLDDKNGRGKQNEKK